MFTHKNYMDETTKGAHEMRAAHRKFYGEVVEAAGVRIDDEYLFKRCKLAFENGDEHFNTTTRMSEWDMLALRYRDGIRKALKERGDFWSLSGGLCTMKEAMRLQIEREGKS